MKNRKNRLTALLLAFVMTACLFWDIPAHAEDVSSSAGKGEKTSAVSESSGPAASPEGEGGAQSEAETPASSEGQTSEAPASEKEPSEEQASEAPSSEEQPSEEAKDSSSEPEEEHYELEEQELTADVYTDEKRNEESDDGTVITVEGELPEGASVEACPVEVEDFDGEKVLAAYDITIYDPDGGEFQPEDPVQVSISAPELKDADSVDIYHLKDAGDEKDDAEQEDAEEEDADGKETAAEEKDEAKDGGKDADAGAERDDADEDTEKDAEEAGGVRARVELDGDTKALNAAKVAEGVKPKNKKVKFQADSFSIYVVTGKGNNQEEIRISNGEKYYIAIGETITLTANHNRENNWSTTANTDIIDLETYQYQDGNNSRWNATVKGLKQGTATVTFGYNTCTIVVGEEGDSSLNSVKTVDSKSQGVQLEMFDYTYSHPATDGREFSILQGAGPNQWQVMQDYTPYNDSSKSNLNETYAGSNRSEGLLQRVVGSGSFPETVTDNSLSNWFTTGGENVDSSQKVNHLFLKDYYDRTGYFHYNSAENFAALNGDIDTDNDVQNFTVYDKLGIPSDYDWEFFKRGNFLPYNTIGLMKESQYNHTNKNGPLYVVDQPANFHFGMYMNTDFLQPEGGLVPKDKADPDGEKKPMKFQFTGDDDLWVYIDGVLILDLGGIHDALNGTIDFSTGVVTLPNSQSTSIQEMLHNAAVDSTNNHLPTGAKIEEKKTNNGYTYTVTQPDGESGVKTTDIVLKRKVIGETTYYTYDDYSRHTLQMFYMERGSGASNLAIDFNLQTVPKDSVTVTKQVKGLNPYWAAKKEYKMQLYVQDEKGDYQPQTGKYTIGTETYSTGEDGTFSLEDSQTAVFSDIPKNLNYYVKEIDPDEPDGITYETTFSAGGEDCTSTTTNQSKPVSVENERDMTVTNTAQNTGSITVTKKLEGFTEGQTFDANFTLYKVDENGDTEIQTASYVTDFKDTDNDGNKSYTFTGLPYGTYYVVETGPTLGILKTTYTVGDSQEAEEDGEKAQVMLSCQQTSGSILVTNTYYQEYTLPKAGGSGTLPFQIIGTVILLGAAAGLGFWLYRNKKKKGAPPKDSS